MNITQDYATTDITLAAVLKEQSYQLDRIVLQGNKGIFWFTDVDHSVIRDYECGKVKVEPQAFHNQIKILTTAVKRQFNKA